VNALIALVAVTAVLVIIPGPNVALIVANSLQFGFRMGVVTALGTTLGVGLQLLLVVGGLTALLQVAADALTWIRWLGVIYLIGLGIKTWREAPQDLTAIKPAPTVFWRGCLLALANPKTLLFNAAFIPQFVETGASGQLALVAAVFLSVLLIGDIGWAAFASSARRLLASFAQWRSRIAGALFVAAGIGLAFARRN